MSPGIDRMLIESNRAKSSVATWSQVVDSFDAVPEKFKSACAVLRDRTADFPFTVFAPSIIETRRKTTEKLLAIMDDAFFVWEPVGQRIVAVAYPLDTITDIEVGEILLYSWLTITGTNSEGIYTSTRIAYNSVSAACYKPFVEQFRPQPCEVEQGEWEQEEARFDFLESEHFKFMNYGRSSLIRGERIHHILWQPKIRKPFITLFGRSIHRTLAVAHLAILSDSEIIFIDDDKAQSDLRSGQYGGIRHYVPLRHVSSIEVNPSSRDILVMSVHLGNEGKRVDKLFEAANQAKVEVFRSALDGLRHAIRMDG